MEILNIPLSQLSIAKKLHLMEALWDDLSRNEDTIESPAWHKDILLHRKNALANGSATVSNWEEAKVRIRKNVS
ncbi:Addiction module component, CHP02574 [Candidatus Magnetomorum sp. HK-1]|nr:Addiction module component, CHP02574 [Candidatus Magnetomorum sp. HK-1]